MKTINRREFIRISGGTIAGFALSGCMGINMLPIQESASGLRILHARQTTTICPYCAVGCGIIVHTVSGKVINTEGDPDHPINEGSLCSKGMAAYQISHNNPNRLNAPLYRPPYGTEWKEVSWDFALDKMAERIKETRDKTFETKNDKNHIVNRTMGIASLGSAALDNEECYIYQKLLRGLGIVYVEHQARI